MKVGRQAGTSVIAKTAHIGDGQIVRPGQGFEHATFLALEGEDGDERNGDDKDGGKNRGADFLGRINEDLEPITDFAFSLPFL